MSEDLGCIVSDEIYQILHKALLHSFDPHLIGV